MDWVARDADLVRRVTEALAAIRARSERPRRITRALLQQTVGQGWLVMNKRHLARLPRTAAAVAAGIESVEQAASRRLAWVAARARDEGSAPHAGALLFQAGIARADLRATFMGEAEALAAELRDGGHRA